MINKYNFQYFTKNIDIIFALMGFAVGSIILLLHYLINLNQLDIGLVIIFSCLFYLLFKNSFRPAYNLNKPSNLRHQKLLNIFFFTLYPITLFIYHNQLYLRPFSYFVLISLLVGILSIEIIVCNGKSQIQLLSKILLLSATFWFETFYNFPSLSGADSYWHTKIVQLILDTAHMPSIEISYKYFYYPIFHILVSVGSIIPNIDIKDSLFFTISFPNLVCSIFLYLISSRIFNKSSGLITVLLYNFSDSIIDNDVLNMTPSSLVLCYFLVIIHIYYKNKICIENRLILLFLTFISVITHQLSTFVVFISLFSTHFARTFHLYINSSKNLLVNTEAYIFAFAVLLQFYWMKTYVQPNKTFFDFVVGPMINALTTEVAIGNEAAVTTAIYYSTISNILFHLGYLIILFIGIGGILSGITSKDNREFSISIVLLILFFFIYSVPLLGLGNMLTGRWFPFVTLFLVILAPPYLLKVVYSIKSNRKIFISFFMITSIITFFMITTPNINKDNQLYAKERFSRTQFKESEITPLKIINLCNTTVKADRTYSFGIIRQTEKNIKIESVSLQDIFSDNTDDKGKLILLRKCSLEEPVGITDSSSGAGKVNMKLSQSFFEKYNSLEYYFIYSNGNVNGYFKD